MDLPRFVLQTQVRFLVELTCRMPKQQAGLKPTLRQRFRQKKVREQVLAQDGIDHRLSIPEVLPPQEFDFRLLEERQGFFQRSAS